MQSGQRIIVTSIRRFVIDHDLVHHDLLPDESAIASVTLAELAAGTHATDDAEERARRQDRLLWAASTWDPLPLGGGTRVRARLRRDEGCRALFSGADG
ncbi:MAG: hypothetical protein RMM28_04580 [Thermoleophilia bacterium]|nr:hypothetical protein [Gaiellaceae bacterium]MDW8338399.1 hypothetical protein [Thermoleophilia bacterium]